MPKFVKFYELRTNYFLIVLITFLFIYLYLNFKEFIVINYMGKLQGHDPLKQSHKLRHHNFFAGKIVCGTL